jgi:ubiquinone/menaquinone biosynthesis C-methylase UbiE
VTTDGWQLEGASPELYQRYLVPAVTLPWAVDLVDRVGIRPGDRVLDVACGTGVVARVAAERAGEAGRVAGLDVNSGMLAVARSLPPPQGAAIEWVEGSALALPFPDGVFEVGLCQLGLQFVPDPAAALRELRRVLGAGGRAAASVFSAIERNPAAHALAEALDRHVGARASRAKRSEHSLADAAELRGLFDSAGFDDVRIETVERTLSFPSAAEYVRIQLAATPLAEVLGGREAGEQRRLVALVADDVAASLAPFSTTDALRFPQEVHVALAESLSVVPERRSL